MDKLLSGGKVFRDQSPFSGMRGIFHRGDSNPSKTRSKETETQKTRDKMRDGEKVSQERPSDRDGTPCVRERQDGELGQAYIRDRHGRPLSTEEITQSERVVKKRNNKGGTYPRERKVDRNTGRRMIGEDAEMRQRDRPKREQVDDWETDRKKDRRRHERERDEIQSRAIEEGRRPEEDIRTQRRERYKVSGVEFQERTVERDMDRRDRDACRKREKLRPVMDMREAERYSPERRPEREINRERRERTPRRDARSEGDTDDRQLEIKERMRDRKRGEFSRSEFCKTRVPQDRDKDGYQDKYKEERYRGREKDSWEVHGDGGRPERPEKPMNREKEIWREIGADGRREYYQNRTERREKERKNRHEDERADRSNRSLSDSSPRVPPQDLNSRAWSIEGDSKVRYRRDFEREQRKGWSVAEESKMDPRQADEKSQRRLVKSERLDRDETTTSGSEKRQMWLEPQKDKTRPRQEEDRRVEQRDIKSHTEGERERDVRLLQADPDERYKSRERHLERREYNEDSEGVSIDEEEDNEISSETIGQGKEELPNSAGGKTQSWTEVCKGENLLNNIESGTEEECGSDSWSGGGSDGSWNPDRDRMLSSEDSNVTLSSGGEDRDEREQKLRNHRKFSKPENSNKRELESTAENEEVINVEQQEREKKLILCKIGQTSSQSETSELSLSQDEDEGGAGIVHPNIRNHNWNSGEDRCSTQHDLPSSSMRREKKLLTESQGAGNGYSTPRGGSLSTEEQTEGEFCCGAPVDLQDIEVEEIMKKELPTNDMGTKKRDSQTERLLEQWREKNKTNSGAYIPPNGSLEEMQHFLNDKNTQAISPEVLEAMSPEELEAFRIRMSGTWSESEMPKRRSQAPHLKWATSVVREILGHSGEQTEDEPSSEVEESQTVRHANNSTHEEEPKRKSVNLPVLTLTTEDRQSETEQEEDEDYDFMDFRDDDFRSKSWGEVDLKNVLNSIGRHTRKSSFYNRPQLYQQYNEETQNFEILRQSRSDTLSGNDSNSRSPLPSPTPSRRPLPPLPPVPHPHSLSHTTPHNCPQTLPLPEHSKNERRASSPSLSVTLTQSLLWRDLPGVRNSPELERLTEDQRRLQEVRFEVVTSEASYCRSLDIVVEQFVKNKELEKLLTNQDKNWLFSRLTEVRAISHRFLSKLEERMESDVLHFTVCDIIARHCQRFRKVYVPYLTNQSYQDATYQRLMNDNPNFKRVVDNLEKSTVCQRLPLRSFLVLPFQRITRIKLLVQNILKRTTPGTVEAENTIKALKKLEKIIQESNDSITEMKTIESLVSLSGRVEFVDCKTLPLISQKRRLVREGPVTELMDFSLKQSDRTIYLHLFNDYLLVSLQKEGGRFTVIDHCPVNELRTEDFRVKIQTLQKNSFRLHMSQRSLLLRTETQSDKLRWISAVSRTNPQLDFSTAEKSAQMQCIRAYVAQQPDELSVEKADVILVHQDSSDNWVEGIKLSDLHCGWVPKSHLKVISNDKVKKRNLSDALTLTKATAAV
ncbi:trichohyalin isoform X1 [Cyprinodon tularosa]|uniref:trichohyalin isoform X1 n=1 Tax=Cyprinodon tularosa TaxID=77115 RepID=UPI0018E20303|nr:trichohyalin isoform X1 [Cyprinodon tularosa]